MEYYILFRINIYVYQHRAVLVGTGGVDIIVCYVNVSTLDDQQISYMYR